ncbi:TetR/AcrR family transcriptional regulator [Leuconostoc fallax]|nr:TetR/AcrR family transcriptional regulator [Leuconostoc fallax]
MSNTLNTENITPQTGFNFSMAFGTPLKLINAKISAGTARSNQRSGARVPAKTGNLLPISDAATNTIAEEEYDTVFISGKDKTPHGRVRSADSFDSHDLVLYSVTPNYKTDNRGEAVRDDYDEPIISNYQSNFIQQSKSSDVGNGDNIVRILVDPAGSERLQAGLKPGDKLVPQGLKFAFVGNDATGFSRGAIYHHFKNKNEIMQSVLNEIYQEDTIFFADLTAQKLATRFDFLCELLERIGIPLLSEKSISTLKTYYLSFLTDRKVE